MGKATLSFKAAALVAGFGLGILSYPVHAAPSSGGDTVKGLYDALLSTMKNGRMLGQSGRFKQVDPVIRRSFDIASMARLSIGPSWTGLSDVQHQQVTDSFGRYISAIYADRFDSYAGQKLEVTGEQPAPSGNMGAISEVATRRSEFAVILKNGGIDGLIAALNSKTDALISR